MGYEGKGPLDKQKQSIVEPIQLKSKINPKHKSRLGYDPEESTS
jgi:hypothetical protein